MPSNSSDVVRLIGYTDIYNVPSPKAVIYSNVSSLGIAYTPETLPTPWPILLIGFFLSLALAIYGTVSSILDLNRSEKDLVKDSVTLLILRYTSTAISTIRSFSAFIATVRAIHSPSERSSSITATLMLAGSIGPSVMAVNKRDIWRAALCGLNLILASWATFLTGVNTAYRATNDKSLYGDEMVFGGSCVSVEYTCCGCDITAPLNCSDPAINSPTIGTNVTTSNCVLVAILLLFIAFGALYSPVLVVWAFRRALMGFNHDDGGYAKSEYLRVINASLITGILICGLITIPIHGVGERGQTVYVHNDGITANGSAWSTCFPVREPYDYWGFLKEWWSIHKHQATDFLSLV